LTPLTAELLPAKPFSEENSRQLRRSDREPDFSLSLRSLVKYPG
jgi:hypothetical protein